MKSMTHAALFAVALSVAAQAQFTATLPKGYDTLDGNYATSLPFNTAAAQLWQFAYDWTQMTHQCPVTITQIEFRRSTGAAFVGGTFPNATVAMSTLASPNHNTMSGIFANNRGPDYTVVYTGPITILPFAGTTLSPGQPAPWHIHIPFQTPFEFDPVQKLDILVELTLPGPNPAAGFIVDGQFPTAWGARNGHASSATATAGNTANSDAAPVINLTYTLGASTKFDLAAFTGGGGQGDLVLAMANVPAATSLGFTVISTLPAPILGRGPVFGLALTPLVFSVVTTAPSPGNPVAWTYPTPGFYPSVPFALPPGALSVFAGQVWEVAGVALNGAGQVIGVTAARQLAW